MRRPCGIAASAWLLMGLVLAVPVTLSIPLRAQPAPGAAQTAPIQPAPIQPAPAQAAPTPPPGMPTVGIAPAPSPPPPPAWLPRPTAVLQIVEKVDATHRSLTIPVGSTTKIGTLAIEVKACVVRPPGQERDAAAYLDIVGKDKAAPLFKGWILAAEPAVSVFQDPIYDVRVTGCE
ncbi:MAG: DUF2155 domain-containing protein [Acetobacteraceae bacterium]